MLHQKVHTPPKKNGNFSKKKKRSTGGVKTKSSLLNPWIKGDE